MIASSAYGSFQMRVVERAAELADQFGVDVEEAFSRWEVAGGQDAGTWLSVAFMFARHDRSTMPLT